MADENTIPAPRALMLLSGHCVHCPNVLDSLGKMIKAGDIGSFEVINLEEHPEAMQEYNVRSVPWVKIGKHELAGAQTIDALKQRAEWAKKDFDNESNTDNNKKQLPNQLADFDFLLSDGQVNEVIEALHKDNSGFESIMGLLGDTGTVLSTRIGIGVVFEAFAGTDFIKTLVSQLGDLANNSDDVRVRADALHYLGMTADKSAIQILKKYTEKSNDDSEIQEIIADSLGELTG